MLGLSIANQEFVLPNIDGWVVENRQNLDGEKDTIVKDAYDANGTHVSGTSAIRKELLVKKFTCVIQPRVGRDSLTSLQSELAHYIPPAEGVKHSGGWMLTHTTPGELENWTRRDLLEPIVPGKYFLATAVDFDAITRSKNWFLYLSTWDLLKEIDRPGSSQLTGLAVIFHTRLTRPILGIVLVVLGLSVILRDQNRNIFISAGLCLVLCATFFALCLACQFLGTQEYIAPALSAWLPVLLFGPACFVMFDAVHT
jgi:lipopolysaccharide export system permease protein